MESVQGISAKTTSDVFPTQGILHRLRSEWDGRLSRYGQIEGVLPLYQNIGRRKAILITVRNPRNWTSRRRVQC